MECLLRRERGVGRPLSRECVNRFNDPANRSRESPNEITDTFRRSRMPRKEGEGRGVGVFESNNLINLVSRHTFL